MKDADKTKEQLISELAELRQRIAELEKVETEHERAEEALQKSEHSYRTLAEDLPWIVYRVFIRENNRMQFFNGMLPTMTGYKVKELEAGPVCSIDPLIVPEDRAGVIATVKEAIKKNKPFEVEYRLKHKDGKLRHFFERGRPIYGEDEKPLYIDGVIGDITERKRAEEEIRQKTADLSLINSLNNALNRGASLQETTQLLSRETKRIFSSFGATVYLLSEDKKYLVMQNLTLRGRVASHIEKAIGIRMPPVRIRLQEGSLYLKVLEVDKPQLINDPETIQRLMAECTEDRRLKKLVPRIYPILGIGSVINAPLVSEGKIIGLLDVSRWEPFTDSDLQRIETISGQVTSILKHKRTEEALRESEEKYSTLVERGNDGIIIIQDGLLKFINSKMVEMTGFSLEEALGRSFTDFIAPEYIELVADRYKRRMAGEEIPNRYEIEILPKDGKKIPAEINASIIEYLGKPADMAIIGDITERKQAEEGAKRLREELYLSSRLAAIGELAAGVAHEINNPLTGIMGYSELLLRKPTDENTKKGLEIIHSSSLRMAKIVQNLLTFARRHQPKKEYVDINKIVKEALELRAYELKTSNIEVALDLASDLPPIMSDFQQIQEVFLNLILNTEQAMSEAHRGGKLTIKTKQLKNRVRVSFADDGPGIPTEHLDKLFDPFFTTREEKGGTGLGLSICHGIVEEHGGRIYAKSKPGKGTTLFVELPMIT